MVSWFKRHIGMSAVVTFIGASISALGSVSGLPVGVVVFGALVAAGGALWSSGERAEFERGLREKSDEIADLNRQIAASVTGGDSFPYLTFASLGVSGPNTAILTLLNQSEHPLYELNGYIADLQESRQVSGNEHVTAGSWFKEFQVGNMSPNSARPLMDWQLPETDEQDYNVCLNARNGFFTQLIRLRRVDGSWKVATRVWNELASGDESPTLYLDVDAGFPLNERGEVDWS